MGPSRNLTILTVCYAGVANAVNNQIYLTDETLTLHVTVSGTKRVVATDLTAVRSQTRRSLTHYHTLP